LSSNRDRRDRDSEPPRRPDLIEPDDRQIILGLDDEDEGVPQRSGSGQQGAARRASDPIRVIAEGRSGGAGRGACLVMAGMSLVCLGIPCAIVIYVLVTGVNTIGGIFEDLVNIFRGEPESASVVSTATIVQSIRAQGTYTAFSTSLARSDVSVSVRSGLRNVCGYNASHNAEGTIEAGVDLSRLTPEDVTYNELTQTFTITLPPPQLTNCLISTITQYHISQTFCEVDEDGTRQLAQYVALTGFRDDALEAGILERAEEEMLSRLPQLFELTSGGATVRVQFSDQEPPLPATCNPSVPPDWAYNEEQDRWQRP
jgi:hypothetical protein